uniref:Uncharacterized protein n=1 Tax=Monopterus albus TaxID=43700 RepID=A0A3Q3JQX7_MONAL
MGDWSLLGSILEEVHIHSTIVGNIWLAILFIFWMLVLGVAAQVVWDDKQSEFVCNTEQPGCKTACYNQVFPISYPLLSPSNHLCAQKKSLSEGGKAIEPELRKLDEQKRLRKAPLRGSLLHTYVFHILTRLVLMVGFIIGQYYGIGLSPLYKCERLHCPNSKNIFLVFLLVIGGVSLFLSLLEIYDDSQVCVLTNSSPQRFMQRTQMTCPVVSDDHGMDLPSQANIQSFLGAVEWRYNLGNRKPSCSSDDSNGSWVSVRPIYTGPRPILMATHIEIPEALRDLQRKHSRVSVCKELSEMSDSPMSDHYPTTRKYSFMSRGLSEAKLVTPALDSPMVIPLPLGSVRRMSMVRTENNTFLSQKTKRKTCRKVTQL